MPEKPANPASQPPPRPARTRPAGAANPSRETGPEAIWAPWRLPYLEGAAEGEAQNHHQASPAPKREDPGGCFLAEAWADPRRDQTHLVIHRDAHGLVMLNRYPYSNGHLLVALGEGRPRLLDYDAQQRAALWSLVDVAADLMERTLEPQGINIGVNQGRAAGAGVPQHLHVHLVPRWGGDTNFMTAIGQIRVIPASLEQMWERYRLAVEGR